MSSIVNIIGREIIDSRGNPTVEADVILSSGAIGRASVPSGASTGTREASELRDSQRKDRFFGRGVLGAVDNINSRVLECLVGTDSAKQEQIDNSLIEADGTDAKSNLGANAILAVSLATARATANELGVPLHHYIGGLGARTLPTPMMNIINGGAHANNSLDIQEFMIVPYGFKKFSDSIRCGAEIFQSLKSILSKKQLATTVGDEGGFAPDLKNTELALDIILQAINKAGYSADAEVGIALDCASSEFFSEGEYFLSSEGLHLTSKEFVEYQLRLVDNFPIISIEDGMGESDFAGWKSLTEELGDRIQLVGDDLFVTNTSILSEGIKSRLGNALLVKYNQIGTLTETLAAIEMAKNAGYATIISHRSGETEDSFIADLAVGTNAGQIKTGSLSRTDRVAKYNQLIRIEQDLDERGRFAGKNVFKGCSDFA